MRGHGQLRPDQGFEKESGPANRTGPMELTPLRIMQKGQGEAFFAPVAPCSQVEQPDRTVEFISESWSGEG
jgi:hypothetical protein